MSVGGYAIHINYQGSCQEEYGLPDCVEPFLAEEHSETKVADIHYTIHLTALHKSTSFDVLETPPVASFTDGPCPYEIYQTFVGDYLWIRRDKRKRILLAFEIAPDWSRWQLLIDRTDTAGWDSFQELAYLFPYSILNKNGILFHGVVMEWLGMGIIVCAHSGVGKTTHTKLWQKHENALILNGDRAICCWEDNRWFTYGAPWCGSSGEYLNRRTPLALIIIICRDPENYTEQLIPFQGALELLQLTFAPTFDERLMECTLQSVDNITRSIPIIKLHCRPDYEAVSVLKKTICDLLHLT